MNGEQRNSNRIDVQQNYNQQARRNQNQAERRLLDDTYHAKAFNNWIKSVMFDKYTKMMCETLEKKLDLRRGSKQKILHVLDIGCGRGQDIKKWSLARVKYMLATDFSEDCLKVYEERWSNYQPFRLYTVPADFTKFQLYKKIEHSYYDIVSAQFCLHYMFKSKENVETGLTSILSNLLIDGYFIATIPDSYTILKKIKQKGNQLPDGSKEYHNKYFSVKINKTNFPQPFGNEYGFYYKNAVGQKDEETGEIKYTYEYLISLDHLQEILKKQGMQELQNQNFIAFYMKNRNKYKDLFSKMGLNFGSGQCMEKQLWEVCHLYRVLVYKKVDKGRTINQFGIGQRVRAIQGKEIRRQKPTDNRRGHSNNHYRDNNFNSRGRDRSHSHRGGYHQNRSNRP